MMEKLYRHKKRGTQYMTMGRATLQIEGPHDMAECIVYMDTANGHVWVRPVSEFFDGRFEEVPG
ncbi:DUF1653 domain-containing protein [Acetobacter lambici]|uniref:DUF1653 domain-containing protein n=1 Tax=Acetobacter lambici TaxID=1332824 RepID=A0ABT1EZH3_9PROT|nr:DUF1653 domain-containing protein [Acetobacter lambici]MCP1243276.1 DUF1653 domain-containing protein [Acetobacter lambici]MCP1258349.1 DUF1653 domain-containing protein [Acetobacter lambici]